MMHIWLLKELFLLFLFRDYSDAFILVAGDIPVNTEDNDGNNRGVVFKNCASFSTCMTDINDVLIYEVNHIYISMPIYNLIEYSDNIWIHQEVCGCVKEMKFQVIMLICLLIILNHFNTKQLL